MYSVCLCHIRIDCAHTCIYISYSTLTLFIRGRAVFFSDGMRQGSLFCTKVWHRLEWTHLPSADQGWGWLVLKDKLKKQP